MFSGQVDDEKSERRLILLSFIEWMVSNMEYCDMGAMFGLGRTILWWLTNILVWAASVIESLYNNIFKVFSVIYSSGVSSFIGRWIGFLWIPIAIAIIILGYNLIMGEDSDGSLRMKTFMRNLCLLVIVVASIPILFTGVSGNSDSSFAVKLFQGSGNNNSITNGVSQMAGNIGTTSNTSRTVVENIYDLQFIFNQARNKGNFTKNWSSMIDDGTIRKNSFYDTSGNIVNGDAVMNITPWDTIVSDDADDNDKYDKDLKMEDCYVNGYDYCVFSSDTNNKTSFASVASTRRVPYWTPDNIINIINQRGNQPVSTVSLSDKMDLEARIFFFQTIHNNVWQIDSDDNGTTNFVFVDNNGKTKTSMWFVDVGSTYPFRYHVEWGRMIISLIMSIIVLYLTSYKIVKLIYEVTVNQLLVLFFGAIDLSNGQRAKEVMKSTCSLLASMFFAVILVQFYYLLTSAVNGLTFVSNSSTNGWIQTLINVFIGMATIKGPSVLEKVLGINGGLGDEWRETGMLNRTAVKPVARATGKVVKGTAILAGAGAVYGTTKAMGKRDERKDRENERKNDRNRGSSTGEVNSSGDSSQFKMAQSKKSQNSTANVNNDKDASGNSAANNDVARQGRDISEAIQRDNIQQDKAEKFATDNGVIKRSTPEQRTTQQADKYRGAIHNAALAEQVKGQAKGGMSDKDALTKAYEGSGFSKDDALRLANRDLENNSFAEKKESFANSISAAAKEKIQDSPLSYASSADAYADAAEQHLQALGFSASEASKINETTGLSKNVMLEDNQELIRNEANALYSSGAVATDEEAVQQAIVNYSSDSSGNYDDRYGSLDNAVSTILANGSLEEGIVRGRTANNIAREQAQINTRSDGLRNGRENFELSPGLKTATYVGLGYMKGRSLETIAKAGYESGRKKARKQEIKRQKKSPDKTKKIK